MIQPITKIGNLTGIILSENILSSCGITDIVDIEVVGNSIILRPTIPPRQGWEDIFKKAIELGDVPENDMFGDITNDFDNTEWTW